MRVRRVLFVDEGWTATVHAARALARLGLEVTVVTASGGRGGVSRGGVRWTSAPPVASDAFVAHVDRVVGKAAIDHVVPLTEPAMTRLWDAGPAWASRIHPFPGAPARALVRHKHRLVAHMAARGIDVPRHVRAELGADAAARAIGLPAVVKGATGAMGARVKICETRAALADALARARAIDDDWIVQEYVPGATYLVGGLFHEGRALRLYAAEKLEQHPPRTGPAIRVRSDRDDALIAPALRAFALLGWTGFASADLVRRPDGGYALLEINPRLWGSVGAAAAAGVDLFTPFAALLAGRVPDADLAFAADRDATVFPRCLLAPSHRGPRAIVRALADADWRHPRFVAHAIAQAWRARRLTRPL